MTAWRHAGIPVVDAHVHVNRFDLMTPGARALIAGNPTFKEMERFVEDPYAFLGHLDREGIGQAWLINYCAKEVMGYGAEVNEWVASYAETDPARLVAVGGYEPADGPGDVAVDRLADLGIAALKIHTVHQHLRPDDPRLEAALARLEDLGMPVVFHTGTSRFPGADNAFADPAPIAAVCERHPDLAVVLAHGGRPDHTRTALDIVREFPNAWLDLSSCPPKRLRHYFGDLEALAPRALWGSDWPGPGVPGMGSNVEAFLALGLSAGANRLILHDNAVRLLSGE
ncbi:MAG TPA: amidohydrolase family protein [Candidatus Thermoplasmatota archaeon]|nr:amidohydrolase family protein [Candidatus Thermoplasmatota archaeon]